MAYGFGMQPGSETGNDPYGSDRTRPDATREPAGQGWAANYPPAYGQPPWGSAAPSHGRGQGPHDQPYAQPAYAGGQYGQPDPFPPASATPAPARGRPGLILLTSFLVQLVAIAAVGNQGVSKAIADFASRHSNPLTAFPRTALVFSWRFTPRTGDTYHIYAAQLLGLLTLFVLAALLSLAVVRGAITFGRALFGVWMSVIVAVLADAMVQRAVTKNIYGQFTGGGNRVVGSLFGGNGFEIMAGILLGFGAGLVAALVAVITRRPAVAAAPVADRRDRAREPEPEPPPPFFGDERRSARSEAGEDTRTLSMRKVHQSVGERRDAPPPTGGRGNEQWPDPVSGSGSPSSAPAGAGDAAPRAAGSPGDSASSAAESTSVFPRVSAGESTSSLPRAAEPGKAASQSPRPGSGEQPTTQFPRPPDDEELGHQPE